MKRGWDFIGNDSSQADHHDENVESALAKDSDRAKADLKSQTRLGRIFHYGCAKKAAGVILESHHMRHRPAFGNPHGKDRDRALRKAFDWLGTYSRDSLGSIAVRILDSSRRISLSALIPEAIPVPATPGFSVTIPFFSNPVKNVTA